MPANVASLVDFEVTIGNEKYSMTAAPSPDSGVVQEAITNTLASIKLEQMCDDLRLTADLIYCAYNGIDPKYGDLRGIVSGLHSRFVELLLKSAKQMENLDAVATSLLPDLTKVFRFLLSGKDETALKFLASAAAKAEELGAGMQHLADEYSRLATTAQTAVEMVERQYGSGLQQIEALKTKLGEIEAENARASELAQRLAKATKDLQAKYEESKAKAEATENRAFALSIIGAIMKPLAEGVGAAAGAFARMQTSSLPLPMPVPTAPTPAPTGDAKPTPAAGAKPSGAVPAPAADPKKSKEALSVEKEAADKVVAAAKEKADAAAKEAADKQSSLDTDNQKLTEAKAAAEKDGLSEADKNAADEAAKTAKLKADDAAAQLGIAEANKKLAEDALKAAQVKAKEIGDALENLGKSIGEAGGNISKMGENFFELADAYRQEKVNFLKLLMEKQEEEDKTIADMKKYALQMKNIDMQEQTLQITVEALFQAIGALKKVVTHLQVAGQFWENMAEGCKRLANSDMQNDIEIFKDMDAAEKLALYAEPEFKISAVRYLAGWVGMQTIAKRYGAQMVSVRDKAGEDYGIYLGAEAARKKAAELGERLALVAQTDESNSGKKRKELEAAIQQADAEATRAAA